MISYRNFIEFEKGTFPLIISVPHGGTLDCEGISKRKNGIQGIDKRTIELARDLISSVKNISRIKTSIERKPSYFFSKVPRSRIDLNRKESEAYNPDSLLGREIYRFYHDKINSQILENIKLFNYSLLIDIHGFEKNQRPQGFRDVELILGTNNLDSFFPQTIPKKEWQNNLRGMIIKKFLELDISIAPGHPRRSEYVLTGGFITQQYGASKIPNSQAIQIEFSDRIRLFDKDLKNTVINALTEVILHEILKY